ncbi:MAG: DUF4296 domain-containing protein [Pricia sp.]|nr:DUF4296 domain-containing protein [Pricia sp.]
MKTAFSFTLFIFLISCNETLLEKPDNLIPKSEMIDILYELAVVNAAKTTNISVLRENSLDPMPYIFEKYGIDSVQFVESDRYYASYPVEYEKMYQRVEAKIQMEIDILKEAEKKEDSLELQKNSSKKAEKGLSGEQATDSLP